MKQQMTEEERYERMFDEICELKKKIKNFEEQIQQSNKTLAAIGNDNPSEEVDMSIEEALEILDIAKAEVEWNYPLNYVIAFDTIKEYINQIKIHNEKIVRCKDCAYASCDHDIKMYFCKFDKEYKFGTDYCSDGMEI